MKRLLLLLNFSICGYLFANDYVGTIIKLQGDVKIFSHPSQKIDGPAPHVLYDGQYYSVKDAKLGARLDNGYILQTGNGSRARIVFKNGDQLNIGEGTSYSISWHPSASNEQKQESVINLLRGQLRAIVSKNGPRSGLKVHTKNAALGVRGTDFYVSKQGNSGELHISVLRGQVELKSLVPTTNNTRTLSVATGSSGSVISLKENLNQMNLTNTSRQQYIEIQKTSSVISTQIPPQESRAQIASLEKAALKVTVEDIKYYQPQFDNKKIKSISELNSLVVKTLYQKTPRNSGKDFDLQEEDPYEKYFHIE